MKFVKIVLGTLACMFVLMHLVEIPSKLGTVSGSIASSWWTGKAVAIVLGAIVANAFFRSAAGNAE